MPYMMNVQSAFWDRKAQTIILMWRHKKTEPTDYDIINRGIFYVSRLISSQKRKAEIILNMYEEYSLEQIAKVARWIRNQ